MTKTITISEETWDKIKAQVQDEAIEVNRLEDLVGAAWFFRTVTFHLVGRVKKTLPGGFLLLEDASWVADSGRFSQAIKNGALSEVEPVGMAILNTASITDAFPWRHKLPTEQK
jgi:hypothetical protein